MHYLLLQSIDYKQKTNQSYLRDLQNMTLISIYLSIILCKLPLQVLFNIRILNLNNNIVKNQLSN